MYRTFSVFPEPGLRRDSADRWLTSQMLSPSVPPPQSSRSVLSRPGAANAEQSFIVYSNTEEFANCHFTNTERRDESHFEKLSEKVLFAYL